jgi:hypothetical protein
MQVIKVTDYNAITILERKDNVIYFRWNNDQRKHRAKIRQDEHGRDYFNSYHLQIRIGE